MRYVPVRSLKEDQVLAQDLSFDDKRIVLRHGVRLTPKMILRIRQLGFQGAYIEDDLSEGLVISSLVSDELQSSAKRAVQTLFVAIENNNRSQTDHVIGDLQQLVSDIVGQLLANQHVVANIMDLRAFDDYTYSHSVNVSLLSSLIGITMRLPLNQLQDLALGALLHDIGKVFVGKELLNKKEKLTTEEFDELKRHPQYGYDFLLPKANIPDSAKRVALSHHEKYDGSGYPRGLSGTDIPLYSRIVCIADIYDALTSDRPYRQAMLPSDALEYIMGGYGSTFDAMVIDHFLKKVALYPVGTCVRLSTGEAAIVIENYPGYRYQPKVRIIRGGKLTADEINLAFDRNALHITIVEILDM